MASKDHYTTKFKCGSYYHVYNRAVDKKAMFKSEDNYRFFLKKYKVYLAPVLDTFAYCLLGNHFHLLVKIKDLEQIDLNNIFEHPKKIKQPINDHTIVSHQFKKFFQSYAMAFNKKHNRTGTLFQRPFKRALVDDKFYFAHLVHYIHANPQLHCITKDFTDWPWSSYHSILSEKPSLLKREQLLEWFNDKNGFEELHQTVLNSPLKTWQNPLFFDGEDF